MYFPYLRGKQYELLALKEMSPLLGRQGVVSPIIEPVRSPRRSGLGRCISALRSEQVDFVLVVNPSVGELVGPGVNHEIAEFVAEQDDSQPWNLGLLVDEATDVRSVVAAYRSEFAGNGNLALIHRSVAPGIAEFPVLTADLHRSFDVIDERWRRRYFRELLETSRGVTLSDRFPGEERNAAYLDRSESVFTDDHLFYREERWFGFSDYLTIGEPYVVGGFMPRAVAIHWTYEREPGGPIMIRHFTSESNGDTANVGGKFLEAAAKLVSFLDYANIQTQAANVVRGHLRAGTFPGLGILKKLSIQNHLELVSGILCRP